MNNSKKIEKKAIVKRSEDFDRWYTDVILRGELADYSPVKGCMIIRPYGYEIWERIQLFLDGKFKELGVKNAYFPLFIPNSFLTREKEHVEGFSPQLAVVTIGGGEKLNEPLVVRPTSETIMYDTYSRWIQSWRDLPLLINLWNNVVRWEKRTYLFLRTTEFLWQEGHTAHAKFDEADKFARTILDIYQKFDEEVLGIPVIIGKKSESEKFPGASITYSLEALMPDGRAIQMGTSHHLGDNFAKAFNIRYLDKEGHEQYVWQTSWAETTRVIGALIMNHGDDQGLVLPPNIAPIQIVIVPINNDSELIDYVSKIKSELQKENIRIYIDSRNEKTIGWKFNEWELKGVPVRIEVGKREKENGELTVVRRDTYEKIKVQRSTLKTDIIKMLKMVQQNLFEKSRKFREENTHKVDSFEEFKKIMSEKKGFLQAYWCENKDCEAKIKTETKASTRILPLNAIEEKGNCIYCGKEAKHIWYFAQAY
jgi:prolyl-tRNA synthetase